jgi:hypothetical protein
MDRPVANLVSRANVFSMCETKILNALRVAASMRYSKSD